MFGVNHCGCVRNSPLSTSRPARACRAKSYVPPPKNRSMPQLTSDAKNAARASCASDVSPSPSRSLPNPLCTALLHDRPRVFTQWLRNAAVYSPSRNRAISLVPPITRQSTNTCFPARSAYHRRNATANSCRIASLCGVMITSDTSACADEGRAGRNKNGNATVATSARMMITRCIAQLVLGFSA